MIETERFAWRRALVGETRAGLARILFVLLGPATAWALHFLFAYFLVALFCTTGGRGATGPILAATGALALVSAGAGVMGYRAWRRDAGGQGWAEAVTGGAGWVAFLLVMGVLSSVLFTTLIVLEGLPPLFVPPCAEVPA